MKPKHKRYIRVTYPDEPPEMILHGGSSNIYCHIMNRLRCWINTMSPTHSATIEVCARGGDKNAG